MKRPRNRMETPEMREKTLQSPQTVKPGCCPDCGRPMALRSPERMQDNRVVRQYHCEFCEER